MKCPSCGKNLWLVKSHCPFCRQPLPPIERPKRPWPVSLVCWAFFAIGMVALVVLLLPPADAAAAEWRNQFRLKQPLQYYALFLMPVLLVASSLLMLRGLNLARWFFVIWFGNAVFWQIAKNPKQALYGALTLLIGVLILFLPASNAFFRPPPPAGSPKDKP